MRMEKQFKIWAFFINNVSNIETRIKIKNNIRKAKTTIHRICCKFVHTLILQLLHNIIESDGFKYTGSFHHISG